MLTSPRLSRRRLIQTASALPLAAALPAWAEAPMLGASVPRYQRFKLGAFEVTLLLGASATREDPHSLFGTNATAEAFALASAEANIPTDKVHFYFIPVVVNTGEKLVLFDTGLSPEDITSALAEAGYTPDQIDMVVLTHMHGDHIGGLGGADGVTFPNAEYATARVEFDAWAKQENEGFETLVRPLAEKTVMMEDGASGFSGHTAMAAFGHTPGHMVHLIESEGKQLLIAADFANHYVWSLARPDWHFHYDMDKEQAAQTRRRLLDMMAADKLAFAGYHMPWPGVGYVEAKDGGYRYVPESYQLSL